MLVAAGGKRFAYMKASEGTDLVDEFYANNRTQAKSLGLKVGRSLRRPDRALG
jgi:GH25 family lysozyme M1 (1,4-beta-N-acetylmuramidase)